MDVILFGATGMVGQGVLRECLRDPEVEAVLAVGRGALTPELTWPGLGKSGKLRQLVLPDLANYASARPELVGYDACLFCLGVSSAGMTEDAYRRVTFGYTLAAAETLVELNPAMTFLYISGAGTDSTAKGRTMWARVKGETENALLALPFQAAYMFRPGFIQPLHGIRSKTRSYRILYGILAPLSPLLLRLFPKAMTTTERLAKAMLRVAKQGYPRRILEAGDICSL
jgi:uncharacterized protein YbjT (DUF2867 family)